MKEARWKIAGEEAPHPAHLEPAHDLGAVARSSLGAKSRRPRVPTRSAWRRHRRSLPVVVAMCTLLALSVLGAPPTAASTSVNNSGEHAILQAWVYLIADPAFSNFGAFIYYRCWFWRPLSFPGATLVGEDRPSTEGGRDRTAGSHGIQGWG
jgi:hypothetical protein